MPAASKARSTARLTPALAEAVKVCPDPGPVLRIETNMHTARQYRLGDRPRMQDSA